VSFCFFFSSRRRHTRWPRDWSSDVCSSDLEYLLDVLFRRGRSNDENQIVITLFHGDLFPSLKTCCVRGFATSRGRSSKSFSISAPAVPAVPARRACGGCISSLPRANPASESFPRRHRLRPPSLLPPPIPLSSSAAA